MFIILSEITYNRIHINILDEFIQEKHIKFYVKLVPAKKQLFACLDELTVTTEPIAWSYNSPLY